MLALPVIAIVWIVVWIAMWRGAPVVRRRAPGSPAARAVMIAGVAAALAVVQWYVVTRLTFGTPNGAILLCCEPLKVLQFAAFVALLAVVIYPAAWACTVLIVAAWGKGHVTDWRLIAAPLLVVVVLLVSGIHVIRLEADLARARWRADQHAFHRLYAECQNDEILCDLVPEFLGTPSREGVLAWIAADPMAPPDIIGAMAHAMSQTDRSLTDALSNPQLPVAEFTDSTILQHEDLRYHLLSNPRVPEAVVDSLLVHYPHLRAQVAGDDFYLRHRASPFTLGLLGADTSVDVRSRVAASFRTPEDWTATLAGDSSRLVRDGAQLVQGLRAYFRTANPSPLEAGGEPDMIRFGPRTDSAAVLVVRSLDGDSRQLPRTRVLWRALMFRARGQWQIVGAAFLDSAASGS